MADRIGVDTGGTFTDFVWLAEDGRWRIHKQLSTPDDPSRAILAGMQALAAPGMAAVVHGSTVATNALLERRGARTALITTKGFGDVLAIGRQNRPELYALVPQKPEPLVPKGWRFEVEERVTAQGEILVPLDAAGLAPILARLVAEGIESVAVCLLFSFLRPEHEKLIEREIGAGIPAPISLSSEILPEYREFERMATTVINAYVAPLMGRYLGRLAEGLAPRPLAVMQSNGGIISAATAGAQAARTVLSGPAGGVVGARFVAGTAGYEEIITFDMGGTSTDVALCPGRLPTTAEGEIADLPLRLPMIDIHTVGAGGGSLAYVDAGGALHVGPESAGAEPGPACYRQEVGDWRLEVEQSLISNLQSPLRATTTDANLVLGRLDAGHFLGGRMRLNEGAAREVLAGLAEEMGTEVEGAAWDVLQVANATMERAIRGISVERGHDPRAFTLVAFGGAGPLHACDLAERLQIPRVLVPAVPGVLSALGMLVAEPTKDYSQTIMKEIGDGRLEIGDWLEAGFEGLERRAVAEMGVEGFEAAQIELRRSLDMRYKGQSHELNVGISDLEAPIVELFHEAHERRYGYRQVGAAVEVVTIRVAAVVATKRPVLAARPMGPAEASGAVIGRKLVWFGAGEGQKMGTQGNWGELGGTQEKGLPVPRETMLYDRDRLEAGNRFEGPAVVFQYDTTTVIPPGWMAAVDGWGNLIVAIQVVRP